MRAARAAGKVLVEKFDEKRVIRSKGKRDIVTDADFAADHAVREIVCARFPGDAFLSEESAAAERQALWEKAEASNDFGLWVVDPLDGTTNYAQRLPVFAVSIAYYQARQVQVGVVYDPIRRELFSAERRQGAYLNGQPIKPSPTRDLEDAIVGSEWVRGQELRMRSANILSQLVAQTTTARILGSAALSLCYVAAGRFDVYFHLALSPWDVAAALLVLGEAGAKVTTPTGAPCTIHSQSYVATNGHVHAQTLKFF